MNLDGAGVSENKVNADMQNPSLPLCGFTDPHTFQWERMIPWLMGVVSGTGTLFWAFFASVCCWAVGTASLGDSSQGSRAYPNVACVTSSRLSSTMSSKAWSAVALPWWSSARGRLS